VIATAVSTVLSIWAVVSAPVAPVLGVSGLYIAAAIYVPLALWFWYGDAWLVISVVCLWDYTWVILLIF
jgi:hypothetical protein